MRIELTGADTVLMVSRNGFRVLFSFTTPVAVQAPNSRDWLVTEHKYSAKTTRHINAVVSKERRKLVPQSDIDDIVSDL